ncbi:unnamed protein product [Euphydryas editha]|uniref:Uncharacterized protein n=1 Tax=Euphydryas editha TaxID=104508 RepID=A0AAU9U5Y7_EUPED|nr:unnamed protein product [Euphydryas editha]
MSKSCKCLPKTCERYNRHLRSFANADKNKKVLTSNNICCKSEKSNSTGVIRKKRESNVTTPKKTTKSDLSFNHLNHNIDCCKTCGDTPSRPANKIISNSKLGRNQIGDYNVPLNKTNQQITRKYSNNHKNQIQQFYRNDNFQQSSHSVNTTDNMKKLSLNTILEQSEKVSNTDKSIFEIYPDSDEEITFMDPDDSDNLMKIKEFRNKNYFECHSAKSRVKDNIATIKNHKCVYRFYLNERLFPVPINTDYKDNIRCIECYLPLQNTHNTNINGTIQAKVKINNEIQDMLLILPVNNSLIVNEKRKKVHSKEDESIYFGIIKLDLNGNSIFNRSLPEDSLALRYQKGYKEFSKIDKYEYESLVNNDIVII